MKRYLPFLAILVLLGALAAQAATAAASPVSPSLARSTYALPSVEVEFDDEEEGEGDEDEFELEECEAEDFGFEFDDVEGEEELTEAEEDELEEECEKGTKDGKDSPFVTAPAACKVSRAESTIVTMPSSDQIRLTVRYRSWTPTPVAVGVKLRDGKGAVTIGHAKERLGKSGVLHVTTKLAEPMMERALRAGEFDVSLLAPGSPAYCAGALEQRLRSAKPTSLAASRVYSSRS